VAAPTAVLVVDDDAGVRELLQVLLASHVLAGRPYRVRTAATGEEALAIAFVDTPALVVTDLGLPGMHGLELVRRLKADPRTAAAPVIAISGLDLAAEAIAAGSAAFQHKPVRLTDLRAVVDELLPR
jgi:CheY-like chemotaxis protein